MPNNDRRSFQLRNRHIPSGQPHTSTTQVSEGRQEAVDNPFPQAEEITDSHHEQGSSVISPSGFEQSIFQRSQRTPRTPPRNLSSLLQARELDFIRFQPEDFNQPINDEDAYSSPSEDTVADEELTLLDISASSNRTQLPIIMTTANDSRSESQLSFSEIWKTIPELKSESDDVKHFFYICDTVYEEFFSRGDRDVEFIRSLKFKLGSFVHDQIRGHSYTTYEQFKKDVSEIFLPEISLASAFQNLERLAPKNNESLKEFGERVDKALKTLNNTHSLLLDGTLPSAVKEAHTELAISIFAQGIRHFETRIVTEAKNFTSLQAAINFAINHNKTPRNTQNQSTNSNRKGNTNQQNNSQENAQNNNRANTANFNRSNGSNTRFHRNNSSRTNNSDNSFSQNTSRRQTQSLDQSFNPRGSNFESTRYLDRTGVNPAFENDQDDYPEDSQGNVRGSAILPLGSLTEQ